MKDEQKISVIICAYNEEPRIGSVLRVVAGHPLLAEIIVINDGSVDKTAEVVQRFPSIRLISLSKNQGKSFALAQGIRAATYPLLMLLDADLVGLTTHDIEALAEPMLSRQADVVFTMRQNSLAICKLAGIDYITGERMVRRELLLPLVDVIEKLPSYGIEVFMNEEILRRGARLKIVYWDKVRIVRKSGKIGFWKGYYGDIMMTLQICKLIPWYRLVYQNYALLRLRIPSSGEHIGATISRAQGE